MFHKHAFQERHYNLDCIRCWPKIHHPPIRHEAESMEELEHVAAGLVHGGDDRDPLLPREPGDAAHDVERRRAVEPAGGLVEEHQRRRRQQLDADAHAPALPAADPLAHAAADAVPGHCGEPHLLDGAVGALPLLGWPHRVRQLELHRVVDGLRHRQRRHQQSLLGHVGLQCKEIKMHHRINWVGSLYVQHVYCFLILKHKNSSAYRCSKSKFLSSAIDQDVTRLFLVKPKSSYN